MRESDWGGRACIMPATGGGMNASKHVKRAGRGHRSFRGESNRIGHQSSIDPGNVAAAHAMTRRSMIANQSGGTAAIRNISAYPCGSCGTSR